MTRRKARSPVRRRVVVAGLGDTGIQVIAALARHRRLLDVVGISPKPGYLSGRHLEVRLARPTRWEENHRIAFHRFRRLDDVRTIHGRLVALDTQTREVEVHHADGSTARHGYDILVVCTGVRDGLGRTPSIQDDAEIDLAFDRARAAVIAAPSLAVVGGGPTALESAAQIAQAFPGKRVDLYFPGERPLVHHHERVWDECRRELRRLGVGLHPGHRAEFTPGQTDRITAGPLRFRTGQAAVPADLVLYAVGGARPNTEWLPSSMLDDAGFVRVDPELRTPGHDGIWAVGDVAATDPLRTTARNRGAQLLVHNVLATVRGRRTRRYTPRTRRWGTVLHEIGTVMTVFTTTGRALHHTRASQVFQERFLLRRVVYGGVRPPHPGDSESSCTR